MKRHIPAICICISLAAVSVAHGHGDVHERIEKLTKQLRQHPTDETLVRRARLYLEEGHADAAREDLLEAIEIAPDRYESFYYLAQANLMLKQPTPAMEAVEQFIAKADNGAAQARGLSLRGDALMAAGKSLEASSSYVAALSRTPDADAEHYIKAADAFHAAGRGEALEVLEQGIAKLGPIATLQERALVIEMATARHEAALQRVERMLTENQRAPFLLYKKGLILKALERPAHSEQAFRQALGQLDSMPEGRRNTRAVHELRHSIAHAMGTVPQLGGSANQTQ